MGEQTRSFGKFFDLLIVFLAIQIIPFLSSLIANWMHPILFFLDPDNTFLWVTIHHLAQLALTIALMKLYSRMSLRDWGFNLNEYKPGLKILGWFCLIFFFVEFLGAFLIVKLCKQAAVIGYPLTLKNIVWAYGFEGLLSGTCEEPLFRGFAMIILAQSWKGQFKMGKIGISYTGFIAALLFTYAHIGYKFFPFIITQFNPLQLLTAFVLGIVYAKVFEKTRSLLAPILIHNAANVIVFIVLYLFALS